MTEGEKKGFDKISFELGRNAEGLEALKEAFADHERHDDRRHEENIAVLKEIKDNLKPLIASDALTKSRLATIALLGTGILIFMSWALDATVKWAVGWLLKAKFGG